MQFRIQRVDLTNMTGQLSVLKHGIGELYLHDAKDLRPPASTGVQLRD